MIARPARRRRTAEAEYRQVQRFDECVDHPHQAVITHIIVDAVRQQQPLPPIATLDETTHPAPPSAPEHYRSARFHTASGESGTTAYKRQMS